MIFSHPSLSFLPVAAWGGGALIIIMFSGFGAIFQIIMVKTFNPCCFIDKQDIWKINGATKTDYKKRPHLYVV